ncbi:histone-lysine N-methyltransferase 2D-like [Zingiber officinale]|uniref:Uncharacterized protein n=1 Tax=Zingiber officinale TaxID=94328 RepID=A0A8J5HSR7_ZINOF|nr:histone-lysine N-methyltransferase 2D-like [Zingiber officinale]KAG6534757.1 hypothetical protein ZIOFF_008660 [Zingiber officinale]
MATAVLRSQDCLRNQRHLDAFGPSPPMPVKHRRKKPPRSSPSSSPPSFYPVLPPKSCRRGSAPPARSPPPQAVKSGQSGNAPLDPRRSTPLRTDGRVLEGEPRPRKPLVMQEVRILKRGEDPRLAVFPTFDLRSEVDSSILCSTDRLGPEPQVLPKKVFLADMPFPYAGPAYSAASPAPSSLPIPCFLKKDDADAANNDLASRILKELVCVC